MATMTKEQRLADIRRHVDELETQARTSAADTRARLQRRFDALREEEAAARAESRDAAEETAEWLWQLETDVAIAEFRLASEMADDAKSFAEAVEAELHDWDAAIERLQTRTAANAAGARAQAEAEIAHLRPERNRVAEGLAEVRGSADEAWEEDKNQLITDLDALERKVRDLTAKFTKEER